MDASGQTLFSIQGLKKKLWFDLKVTFKESNVNENLLS